MEQKTAPLCVPLRRPCAPLELSEMASPFTRNVHPGAEPRHEPRSEFSCVDPFSHHGGGRDQPRQSFEDAFYSAFDESWWDASCWLFDGLPGSEAASLLQVESAEHQKAGGLRAVEETRRPSSELELRDAFDGSSCSAKGGGGENLRRAGVRTAPPRTCSSHPSASFSCEAEKEFAAVNPAQRDAAEEYGDWIEEAVESGDGAEDSGGGAEEPIVDEGGPYSFQTLLGRARSARTKLAPAVESRPRRLRPHGLPAPPLSEFKDKNAPDEGASRFLARERDVTTSVSTETAPSPPLGEGCERETTMQHLGKGCERETTMQHLLYFRKRKSRPRGKSATLAEAASGGRLSDSARQESNLHAGAVRLVSRAHEKQPGTSGAAPASTADGSGRKRPASRKMIPPGNSPVWAEYALRAQEVRPPLLDASLVPAAVSGPKAALVAARITEYGRSELQDTIWHCRRISCADAARMRLFWTSRYALYVDYLARHGKHPGYKPYYGVSLGSWRYNQRKKYGENSLEPDRRELLKCLPGWRW